MMKPEMRRFRRTTLIMVGCLSVLAGLGLARKVNFEPHYLLILFAPALLVLRKRNIVALYLVIALGLGLGLWRGGQFMQKLDEINELTGQKVVVEASATSNAVYGKGSQLEFTVGDIVLLAPETRSLAGDFRVSGYGEPMIYRGDRVVLEGKIYLTRGASQARMSFAQLEKAVQDTSWINSLTRRFAAGMQSALPEPASSFGMGILIGQRSTLPEATVAALTAVGLVHIVAVSGYNLTVIVRAIARVKLGSKYQRLILSLGLITTFLLITGFHASIVRAAIVAGLSLLAWYYGRRIRPLLIIFFTAALTGMVKPFYVWSDLGWYLSFLAFFGVLVIAPIIIARFFSRQPSMLGLVLIETLCAELMTLPLIVMTFGHLSLVSLLANLLVVPLVPLAMLLSAIAGTAGMLIPQVAGWLTWPATMLLTYILDISRILAGFPMALVKFSISPVLMVASYALIFVFVLTLYRRVKGKIATPHQNLMLRNPITDYSSRVLERGK